MKKRTIFKSKSISLVVFLVFLTSIFLSGCGGTTQKTAETQAPPEKTEETLADLFSKSKNIEGFSYDYVVTLNGEITNSGKFSIMGNKMKVESTTEGQTGITIFDGETILTYDPQQNVAYKISSDMTEQFKTPSEYVEDAQVNTENWKTLETTVYDGIKCRVISISAMNGQDEMKMWVREDYGIPVKVETKSADGNTVVLEYKNMKIGALPDDNFILPAGVKIMDMNEIMNQMPQIS